MPIRPFWPHPTMTPSRRRQRRRPTRRALLHVTATCCLAALLRRSNEDAIVAVDAYVTSGLPGHKHRAWLKSMTADIVDSCPPGELTAEMIAAAPQLMAVWAENPYVPHGRSTTCWSPPLHSGVAAAPPGLMFSSSSSPSSKSADQHGLECAIEVERLLKRLVDERAATGRDDIVLTADEYNAALFGWANSGGGISAAERAEQILIQMQETHEASSDVRIKPDVQSFKAVLLAWSNAAQVQPDETGYAARRAERVLEYMVRLNSASSSSTSEEEEEEGFPIPSVRPDADCFDVVLRLWSSSDLLEAPLRCERLLAIMDRLYLDGNDLCKLRSSSFDAVLTAWCRHNLGGEKDATDALINPEDASQRAEEILRHMETLAFSSSSSPDDIGPNLASYTSVASSYARTGGPDGAQRASSILSMLERRHLANPTVPDLRPDTAIYNICIDAWAKAQTKRSYKLARSLLDRQLQMFKGEEGREGVRRCRPDVYSYTLVLHACAAYPGGSAKERRKVFDAARSTYAELCDDASSTVAEPNHVTHGIMMKACARLLPKRSKLREKCAREVFERACQDGCVGRMVLGRIRDVMSRESLKELGVDNMERRPLPLEWTCNVPDGDKKIHAKQCATRRGGRHSS